LQDCTEAFFYYFSKHLLLSFVVFGFGDFHKNRKATNQMVLDYLCGFSSTLLSKDYLGSLGAGGLVILREKQNTLDLAQLRKIVPQLCLRNVQVYF
jgi:hypothetical protein